MVLAGGVRWTSGRGSEAGSVIPVPGWLQTAHRILPRLIALRREIEPTYWRDSVAELDDDFLERYRVAGIIWDVDGTLMAHHATRLDPFVEDGVRGLFENPQLKHAIVSNCQLARNRELGRIFPEIPVIVGYETPTGRAYRVLRGNNESLHGVGDAAIRGTDLKGGSWRPIRKPSAWLVEVAIREMQLEHQRHGVILVGDQYLTDIASANLAGVRSMKVSTLHRESFPLAVRVSQRLEMALYRFRPRLRHGTG